MNRRRGLVPFHRDSLVLQNSDLNPTILRPPGGSLVIRGRFGLTKSKGLNQPPQIQIMHANQVLNYGLRAAFAEGPILRLLPLVSANPTTSTRPTVRVALSDDLAIK